MVTDQLSNGASPAVAVERGKAGIKEKREAA
jgi:hypothetical protein